MHRIIVSLSTLCTLIAMSASAQQRVVCSSEERKSFGSFDAWMHCLPDAENPDPTDRRRFTVSFSLTDRRLQAHLDTDALTVRDHLGQDIQSRLHGFIDDYLWRDGTVGSVFGPYSGASTAKPVGHAEVLSTNTAPGFKTGDMYPLYRSRTVSASDSSVPPFAVEFTAIADSGSWRVLYGYRYGGTVNIREESFVDALRVTSVSSSLYYFPSTGPVLNWEMGLARRYLSWSSEASVSLHVLYGGAEYDLVSGKWHTVAVGGGIEVAGFVLSQSWELSEQRYWMFVPEIAAPDLTLEHARSDAETETGNSHHSQGVPRPFVSASAQAWPFRRVGLTGQIRWYPWTASQGGTAESLLDEYRYAATTSHWNVSAGVVVNIRPGRRDRIE